MILHVKFTEEKSSVYLTDQREDLYHTREYTISSVTQKWIVLPCCLYLVMLINPSISSLYARDRDQVTWDLVVTCYQ